MEPIKKNLRNFSYKNFIKWLKLILILIPIIFVFYQIHLLMVDKFKKAIHNNIVDIEEIVPNIKPENLPWYFKEGTVRPIPGKIKAIWPEDDPGDRIVNQLMYVPLEKPKILKKIFFNKDIDDYYGPSSGRQIFQEWKCPVNDCVITKNRNEADAVVFRDRIGDRRDSSVPLNQIWIVLAHRSPYLSGKTLQTNWTSGYRLDSDIPAPYGKWAYYNENIKKIPTKKNYAKGKTKKVAMAVSNCNPKNDRMKYALELQKYIDVDIYGNCGKLHCPKNYRCFENFGRKYKFYLAFENANCRHYITENFFWNALGNNMLPIVMGAHPDDYVKSAPLNSYLHVDNFTSPEALAQYLNLLDVNDDLYNSYFQWKGTGELLDPLLFHCRLCALLHSGQTNRTCHNFRNWWNGPGICRRGSWLTKTQP